MEVKKSEKANLENKKALFVQIGLVVALSIVIFAFEYKTYDTKESNLIVREAIQEVEETVIQTQRDEPPPPPEDVPPPETTEFDIVEDDVELENEFKVTSFENKSNVVVTAKTIVIDIQEDLVEEQPIFRVVEQDASFPGGPKEMYKYLGENIKYPQQAKETGTQGKVYLEFVVEVDGRITDIKILRDIGSGCGEEAMRVVSKMPKWKPAQQRGKAVRQYFNLPVNFTLKGN